MAILYIREEKSLSYILYIYKKVKLKLEFQKVFIVRV